MTTPDLAKWLLKQYNLLATDEMPDLHLRTCQTMKQLGPNAPAIVRGSAMTCNCPALNWWLADLAAKRQIVTEVVPRLNSMEDDIHSQFGVGKQLDYEESALLLRLLAKPLAHRPGYREEWRP